MNASVANPTSPDRADAPKIGDAVALLEGVSKTYYKPDGSIMVEALKGVDVRINRGDYLAIMGSSGSGKSTLMNILGCLDKPTGGRFLLADRDVQEMDDESLSAFRGRTVGFVFQAFNLIPQLTIEQNVEVPLFYQGVSKTERRERAAAALESVGLADRMGHRPRELSGGQQQRVAIARALVTSPVILMADEPTGNLDSTTSESILQLFESLHDVGLTILMVTHDDEVADRCERILRLKDGLVEYDKVLRSRRGASPTSPA